MRGESAKSIPAELRRVLERSNFPSHNIDKWTGSKKVQHACDLLYFLNELLYNPRAAFEPFSMTPSTTLHKEVSDILAEWGCPVEKAGMLAEKLKGVTDDAFRSGVPLRSSTWSVFIDVLGWCAKELEPCLLMTDMTALMEQYEQVEAMNCEAAELTAELERLEETAKEAAENRRAIDREILRLKDEQKSNSGALKALRQIPLVQMIAEHQVEPLELVSLMERYDGATKEVKLLSSQLHNPNASAENAPVEPRQAVQDELVDMYVQLLRAFASVRSSCEEGQLQWLSDADRATLNAQCGQLVPGALDSGLLARMAGGEVVDGTEEAQLRKELSSKLEPSYDAVVGPLVKVSKRINAKVEALLAKQKRYEDKLSAATSKCTPLQRHLQQLYADVEDFLQISSVKREKVIDDAKMWEGVTKGWKDVLSSCKTVATELKERCLWMEGMLEAHKREAPLRTFTPPFGDDADHVPTPERLSGWKDRLSMPVPCPPHIEGQCEFDCDAARREGGPFEQLRKNLDNADEALVFPVEVTSKPTVGPHEGAVEDNVAVAPCESGE